MSIILRNTKINEDEVFHQFNHYKRLVTCHNSWLDLYENFKRDPVLNYFYDKACEEFPTADLSDGRIFLMKEAIYQMSKFISDYMENYFKPNPKNEENVD